MPKRKHHLTKKHNQPKIKSMPPDSVPANAVTKPKKSPHILISVVLVLALILIVAALNSFHLLKLSTKNVVPQAKPTNPHALDSCDLIKEGNPLVDELSTQFDTKQGSLKGKIAELERDKIRGSVTFKLQSLDKTQEYKFNILEKANFIVSSITNKVVTTSALKNDQFIQAAFVCNKDTNLLEFTKLNILPNSSPATQSGIIKK